MIRLAAGALLGLLAAPLAAQEAPPETAPLPPMRPADLTEGA